MARSLLAVFSSFITSDEKIETVEVEIAFDFVRNTFPNADHNRLGKYLETALSNRPLLSPHLTRLKRSLTREQKAAFALQLFAVIRAGKNVSPASQEDYLGVMGSLGWKAIGQAVVNEMMEPDSDASPILPRLDFASGETGQVRLSNEEQEAHFRCYRAGGILLLRNMSEHPLWVRGYQIEKDQLIQFRTTDEVVVAGWHLGFDDLNFFLQDSSQTLFLILDQGELTMSRAKSRLAVAKLIFGHTAKITPLRDSLLADASGQQLSKGEEFECHYHNLISVGGEKPVAIESLRRLSLQDGHRFKLPAGRRKVIVSNDHAELSGDSVLVTPGLAGRFVIELEFDPDTGMGDARVIESSQIITANGRPLGTVPLPDGALIRLSSRQALRCRFSENHLDEERNLVRSLEVEGINYSFWKAGKTIDNLSFQVSRGEMVCIIGPSGSGKSTLLEILAGQRRPQSGSVRLNGLSLYERQGRLSPLISFMPQEEALNSLLTTREHLEHACAIRRPHLSPEVIRKRASYIIDDLGLERIAERPVGSADSKSLSGGERSRLNAGLDLIGGGEIFLFDEPISGLSSKDAEHVVEALEGLARDKIVIASLHRPSENVLKSFDRVLLLDRGGKMAFFGPPEEMIHYFAEAQEDLSIRSGLHRAQKDQTGADFVFDILEAPFLNLTQRIGSRSQRRFPPTFWQERFENRRVMAHLSTTGRSTFTGSHDLPTADDKIPAPEPPQHGRRQKWMIFKTHLARAFKSKIRHRGTLYTVLLEAPLLAILIAYTLHASADGSYEFHDSLHLPSYLFLAVTVAMFFGLTNSATEVLRDRPILRRERNCRPHPLLYLGSKFLVLTSLIALQSLAFIAVAHKILEIHNMLWVHLGWMTLTGCCGTGLALLVSVLSKSERTALGSIPLILVPQILLAGALIPFSEMNRGLFRDGSEGRERGAEPAPSIAMPLRYAYEGSIVSQATDNHFEQARRPLQERINGLTEAASREGNEEGLRQSKQELGILFAATASTVDQAREIIASPTLETAEAVQNSNDSSSSENDKTLAQFFVNQRVEGLVELAETHRLDDRKLTTSKVFLAEKKSAFGVTISTASYCRIRLLILTTIFLLGSAVSLQLSLRSH
ncbi:MAG: ATP-binding cassette domain-containing protein [Verrucomicrobiaceae bacterium]